MTEGADPALLTQRQLFFITGASRSGTTLLSFVLRNHRDVFGLKELQFFGEAWDPRTGNRHFSQTQAIEACASIIARQQDGILAAKSTAAQRSEASALIASLGEGGSDPAVVFAAAVHKLAEASGKSIPCEQTPRYVFYARALLDIYPAAHIVHMVRDPRAVMASQKMRWQRRRLAADGSAVPRYQSLRVWVNYHPYTVTRMWSQATRAALALAEHPRVTLLRFEDLVQRPEATVRGLCTRLGLEYDARMLDVGQINSSHQSSAGGARRGLQSGAIDKWRSVLTRTETAIVERDCAQLMRHFAYQKTDPGAISLLHKFGYRLGYLAHLGGVLLVNPRRAYVQGRAMLHARARHPAAGVEPEKVPAHGDPPRARKVMHQPSQNAVPAVGVQPSATSIVRPAIADLREIMGLQYWDVELTQVARFLVANAIADKRLQVYFVNAHCVNVAARNPGYAQILKSSPFLFADGAGMALAARLAGIRLNHNVNGTDLFPELCAIAATMSVPVAFLGARPGIAAACAARMEQRHPGLKVAWVADGYLSKEEEESRLHELNSSGARILFIAKGVPEQELWIASHAARLSAPVVLGVGALFDFYSGAIPRAPHYLRKLRLEWLYRLWCEPRRLFRRYVLGNPQFIMRVLLWRLRH